MSPYEEVWRAEADGIEPVLFVGPRAMEVERFCAECGLGRPEGTNEPLDHIATELHAYKVAGRIRPAYAAHSLHLFDESVPLINIGARPDGAYEVFTCEHMGMGEFFFDGYRVLCQVDWPHALFTNPSIVIEQDLGDGLYRIGDHNALGLEPAAISGVFAANRILGTAAR